MSKKHGIAKRYANAFERASKAWREALSYAKKATKPDFSVEKLYGMVISAHHLGGFKPVLKEAMRLEEQLIDSKQTLSERGETKIENLLLRQGNVEITRPSGKNNFFLFKRRQLYLVARRSDQVKPDLFAVEQPSAQSRWVRALLAEVKVTADNLLYAAVENARQIRYLRLSQNNLPSIGRGLERNRKGVPVCGAVIVDEPFFKAHHGEMKSFEDLVVKLREGSNLRISLLVLRKDTTKPLVLSYEAGNWS